ncbi:MAG: PIN domain-containing protein [Actinomycetia bacterium]|nr:PIN domain-containing protein [Actinomycetes bacterium]
MAEPPAISTGNRREVLTKLQDHGLTESVALETLASQGILDAMQLVAFDADHARAAARLRAATRALGLSFADRACMALAQAYQVPAVTADRTWAALSFVSVVVVR